MPREIRERVAEEKPKKTADVLGGVEALIAEAETAAAEAQREAVVEEIKGAQTKKKISAEAAERAEQLQQGFAALRAEDAFVEDYMYEGAFVSAELETGIAAPEKIHETINALRKSGDALRKLGAVEPKTDALVEKIEALQKLHNKLFDQVQSATVDALDVVKKKHKGEETEFEKRYKVLTESPLVRGIEYDENSPEARERALKQEIVEFLMQPMLDERLRKLEQMIKQNEGQIAKFTEEEKKYGAVNYTTRGRDTDIEATRIAKNMGLIDKSSGDIYAYQLSGKIREKIELLNAHGKELETQLERERLAFEVNRTVIEESLKDEHDETALREGMLEIRKCLGNLRKNSDASDHWKNWEETNPMPSDTIARKILGQYAQCAVSMPEGLSYELHYNLKMDGVLPAQQLVGGNKVNSDYPSHATAIGYLQGVLPRNFIRSRLGDVNDNMRIKLMPYQRNISPQSMRQQYQEIVALKEKDKDVVAFLNEFPDENAFVKKMFEGQGRLWNLNRAYYKVDAGLRGEKSTAVPGIPQELLDAGWKLSKLGALVEPGQNTREVDREYARDLERLSKPQIDAEKAFDVRGKDGEFHIYTTEQAVSLLRRARRDARDIVRNADRAVAELTKKITGDQEGKEGLEKQVERLNAQLEKERKDVIAREEKLQEQMKKERDLTSNLSGRSREEIQRLSGENTRLKENVRKALEQLEDALRTKPGLLGGDKELRATVKDVVEKLK